jgi:hypothetical protein
MIKLPGLPKLHRFFLAAVLLLLCQPAWATKRVALVIGNSAYQNVALLPNPTNDGAVIASTLKNAVSTSSIPGTTCRRTRCAVRCVILPTAPATPILR